jgi:hypothetical protein
MRLQKWTRYCTILTQLGSEFLSLEIQGLLCLCKLLLISLFYSVLISKDPRFHLLQQINPTWFFWGEKSWALVLWRESELTVQLLKRVNYCTISTISIRVLSLWYTKMVKKTITDSQSLSEDPIWPPEIDFGSQNSISSQLITCCV